MYREKKLGIFFLVVISRTGFPGFLKFYVDRVQLHADEFYNFLCVFLYYFNEVIC